MGYAVFKAAGDFLAYVLKIKDLYAFLAFLIAWGTTGKIISAIVAGGFAFLALWFGVFFKKFQKRKNFIKNILPEITKDNLISHSHFPHCPESTWFFRRRIYWPVVPNPNISIIHVAFVNCLNHLIDNGFDVHVLIFDRHYQGRQKDECKIEYQQSARDVKQFVNTLKEHGLRSSFVKRVCYKYETKLMTSKSFRNYSIVCEQITSTELAEIGGKKATDPKLSVLRLLKPISIIAFLSTLEQQRFKPSIALTLCGKDEESIFTKCNYIIKNLSISSYTPYQILLPQFNGFFEKSPGVMDDAYSLSQHNRANLKKLANNYRYDLSKDIDDVDPLLFLVKNVLFDFGAKEQIVCKKNQTTKFNRSDFISKCGQSCDGLAECVIDGVFEKFHDRKMCQRES